MSPWSIEVAGGYRFASGASVGGHKDYVDDNGTNHYYWAKGEGTYPKVNLITTDITGVYKLNDKHAFTLRFGFGTGKNSLFAVQTKTDRREIKIYLFSLMPGYRFTVPVYDTKFKIFAGANVGIAHERAKSHMSCLCGAPGCVEETNYDGAFPRPRVHDSAYGLGYSAEVGLRYEIADRWDVFATYEFSGNTARPNFPNQTHRKSYPNLRLARQLYHGIRAGVSYRF